MKYFYFLILCFLLFASCGIEDRIERREDRLLGYWEIDRATFKDDNALFARNVTADFRGDRITFNPDYTAYYETGTGLTFTGYWRVGGLRDRDDDLEFTIDADFFDPFGNLDFQWLGTIDRLTDNNFNVRINERGGLLRLKWDRL